MNNNDRFKNIAGITYENKINELYNNSKEKEQNNKDNTDDINNLIEVMAEYEEWKEWAKKEAKRRTALIWGKCQYKPFINTSASARKVIY
jgi:hypothetical protein